MHAEGHPQTNSAVTLTVSYKIKSLTSPACKTDSKSYWYSAECWTASATVGLFISTTGLWIFTALLWRSTRRTAQSIVENERPWVGLQTIRLNRALQRDQNISADVVIKNSGRTP